MPFDPSASYGTIATSSGKKYLVQSGVLYDARTFALIIDPLDEFPPSSNIPYFQRDLIPKGLPNGVKWNYVVGRRTGVNNNRVDLWEGPTGTYVFPPAGGIQMKIVSSSASDTGAGVGAQQIHFHYLDKNYLPQQELLTLDGVTPVNTVATDILRINTMHLIRGASPVGNISLTNLAGSVTYAYQVAGYDLARQAIFTVPAGYTGYISQWGPSGGSTAGHATQIDLRSTSHLGVLWPIFLAQNSVGCEYEGHEVPFLYPIPIPATADVKITAISDSGTAAVTAIATIYGWLEPIV
jgi:hypothetical protein